MSNLSHRRIVFLQTGIGQTTINLYLMVRSYPRKRA
jgi:hypothetical protein